jgi:hypothetical protein
MPSILTDGDMKLSPWITPERLKREGALIVWVAESLTAPPPAKVQSLFGPLPAGVEQFAYPLCPRGKPLLIGYAIMPPE